MPDTPPRRRPGRPPIETERIVEAALRIVDEDGAGGLTMRSLAARLNSGTATLYRHFPTRSALVAAVIDRAMGELAVDATAGTWREACKSFVVGFFDVMSRHPNVAVLMADQLPEGPNALAAREMWLSILLDNGFPLDLAARSGAMLGHYVQGFAMQLGGRRVGSDLDEAAYARIRQMLDPERYPSMAAAIEARALPVPLEEEFMFGLELILDSLGRLRERT